MKKNSGLLVILVLNFILSFIVLKVNINNFLLLVIDLGVWFWLYFLYEFLVKKKIKLSVDVLSEYCLYYLINFLLLMVGFIYLEFNFLVVKILILVLIIIFSNSKNIINVNKINHYLLIIDLVLVFLLISPMSPIGTKNSLTDSSVFRYIGTIMTEGKVPYLDVFDHKGIFLYFINYLGVLISNSVGIWIIEVVFLYVTSLFLYKLGRLFTNKFCSIVGLILCFIPLLYTFQGGNLVEEYALPFISISLYLFTNDIKKYNYIKLRNAFYIGVCLGAVLLLRPNMIAVWLVMVIYLLVLYLKNKKYRELFKLIGYFLVGIVIFITPFMIYLVCSGAFNEFIYQYLVVNFIYSTKGNYELNEVFASFIENCKYVYLVILVYLVGIKRFSSDKYLMLFYIGGVVLSFGLIILPKNIYLHYGMIMVPTFMVGLVILIDFIYYNIFKFIKNSGIKMLFVMILCLVVTYNDLKFFYKFVDEGINLSNSFEDVIDVIKSNTDKEDNILFFGNKVLIYLKSDRRTMLKYPYQTIANVNDDVREDFYNDFSKNVPVLIITNDIYLEDLVEFFDNNDYNYYYKQLYSNSSGYVVYRLIDK